MTDPTPHQDNPLANAVSAIFHPFFIFIPALWLTLNGVSTLERSGWVGLVALIILPPTMLSVYLAEQSGQKIYHRTSRNRVYAVFAASIVICTVTLYALNAPRTFLAAVLAIVIWIPMQGLINRFWTKVSAHVGVVTACLVMLCLQYQDSKWVLLVSVMLILLVSWARKITQNHTIPQMILGVIIGGLSATLAYSVMGF